MSNEAKGCIYVLTNPSFPDYVKIGYADDVNKRLKELNRSECVPFSFRLYGYYLVPKKLTDLALHKIIDKLNPDLRSIENIDGKQRKREFYAISAEDAFALLEGIAEIHGLEHNLVLCKKTKKEEKEEEIAEEESEYSEEKFLSKNPAVEKIYKTLKDEIAKIGDMTILPRKHYVSFIKSGNFCDILFRKNKIVIYINLEKGKLVDKDNKCDDVSNKGHLGNGDYAISINSVEDVDSYLISLIKQSYDAHNLND